MRRTEDDDARSISPPVASPCTRVCKIDEATGWCIGCGRSLNEIARWGTAEPTEQAAILARLPGRQAQLTGGVRQASSDVPLGGNREM